MSGVAVIRYLLANDAQVSSYIEPTRIMAGDLPLNVELPAISIKQISSLPLNLIKTNEANKLHTDHVQVTWLFKGPQGTPPGTGYPGVAAMARLVLAACPSQRGTFNLLVAESTGVIVDSITPGIEGPDVSDADAALYSRSRDFIVKWVEP